MGTDAIPGLDFDQFSAQLRTAFFTTKRAWSLLKPEICRHVMTEHLWAEQKSRMEAVQLDGSRNIVDGLILSRVEITGQRSLGLDDEVSVRLTVAGEDYILETATNTVLTGSADPDQWVEVWALRRSRDPDALAGAENPKCPNCGAPLSVDSDGLCTFCEAVVPGAKSNWLVSSIDRPSAVDTTDAGDSGGAGAPVRGTRDVASARAILLGESVPAAAQVDAEALAGIAAIHVHDPDLSIGDLLAEAREMFLKIETGRNQMDLSGLRPYVSDELWQAEVARVEAARVAGRKRVRAFLEVRSIAVADARSDADGDSISLRVTAESADHVIDAETGRQISGGNNLLPWTETMSLVRAAGLSSDPLRGLWTQACPSCGAGFNIGEDGRCRDCGKHVTGGEFDWVVSQIEAAQGGEGEPQS